MRSSIFVFFMPWLSPLLSQIFVLVHEICFAVVFVFVRNRTGVGIDLIFLLVVIGVGDSAALIADGVGLLTPNPVLIPCIVLPIFHQNQRASALASLHRFVVG